MRSAIRTQAGEAARSAGTDAAGRPSSNLRGPDAGAVDAMEAAGNAELTIVIERDGFNLDVAGH